MRKIDSCETEGFKTTTESEQLNELIEITYRRNKPDFADALPKVKEVYDAAIAVLNRYIRNDFSDYERVHAIHDWLAYCVKYDFDLAAQENPDGNDPAFGLVGALINKKAVCDGLSKAFRLLCCIEQIRATRMLGAYSDGNVSVNHAWNKVELYGDWYNVDITLDVWHVNDMNLLNHGYFLVSDKDISEEQLQTRHVVYASDPINVNYPCNKTYDFHKNESAGVGEYSMEVTSQEQLNDIFAAVKKAKGKIGKLELRLDFTDYIIDLSRPEAYAVQIAEAYGKVGNADYKINPQAGVYPYMRYPRGVFVFLIYK